MMTFEPFLEAVQTALNHLYDPAFQPSETFVACLNQRAATPAVWQRTLLQAIEGMALQPESATTVPAESRAYRFHQVLTYRYVQQLTQEECAERLHITARHVRREQNEAVRAVAQLLWQQRPASRSLREPSPPDPVASADDPINGWSAQLHEELTALQRHMPVGSADVGEVLQSVVELLQPVLHSAGIELRTGDLSSGVFASIHPVGLRQLLVRCLTAWSRQYRPSATPCWIEGEVAAATNAVTIRLTGADADLDPLAADALVQELLKTYGGALHLQQDRAGVTLTITLPTAPAIHVLVVDDNEDLLHFYRRYLRDTRYQITALSDGRDLYETVEAVRPDVIILDVMLPGIDGWNLLTNLRQHPLGSTLPIIVCSVIQEEALALALGATGYLAKPVRRSALIEALNAAIRPSSAVAAA